MKTRFGENPPHQNKVTEKAKEESYKKGEVGSSSKGKEEFLTTKRQSIVSKAEFTFAKFSMILHTITPDIAWYLLTLVIMLPKVAKASIVISLS